MLLNGQNKYAWPVVISIICVIIMLIMLWVCVFKENTTTLEYLIIFFLSLGCNGIMYWMFTKYDKEETKLEKIKLTRERQTAVSNAMQKNKDNLQILADNKDTALAIRNAIISRNQRREKIKEQEAKEQEALDDKIRQAESRMA